MLKGKMSWNKEKPDKKIHKTKKKPDIIPIAMHFQNHEKTFLKIMENKKIKRKKMKK